MTGRDDLRGRLDELEDAVDDRTAGGDRLTKRERKAIRAALQHRYTAGPDLAGDPFGDLDARRLFFSDAADHVDDDEDATVLRELRPAGEGDQ